MDQPNEMHATHRGSERRTILVALVTIAFVAVAIIKPWGGSVPTAAPSASPAVVAFAPASTSDTPQLSRPVETPSPTSSAAAPTAPPGFELPMRYVRSGRLDPGTYADLDVDGQGFKVRFTVPAGWTWYGRYLSKGGVGLPDGAAIFFFGGRVQVYADPCHWSGRQSAPPTGLSVRDLMVALAHQPLRSATTPIDRPVDVQGLANRWAGIAVELTVPDDINLAACDGGQFRSWGPENDARPHQGPGQHDLVWAVDLSGNGADYPTLHLEGYGGQRLIIDAASFPGTPVDVMFEIESILESIVVGHWG